MTENKFKIIVKLWACKFQLPPIEFYRDNRIKHPGCVIVCSKHQKYQFTYSFKKISKMKNADLYQLIFHELGHVKYARLPKSTEKNLIKCEYMAERFGLDSLKKHFPKYYKTEIKEWKRLLKSKKEEWEKEYPIHYKAFTKIKEYRS